MSEPSEDLHETLGKLHEELEAAEDLDDESRRRLRDALAEIQAKLGEGEPEAPAEPPDWVDRLRDTARDFQTSHPDLVRAIDRVARALSDIGF